MKFEDALVRMRDGLSMTFGDGEQIFFMVDGKLYFNYRGRNYLAGMVFASAILAEDWKPMFLADKEVSHIGV